MSVNEAQSNNHQGPPVRPKHRRAQSRAMRPRSAITSGRELFADGDSRSAWSRRFHDLLVGHVSDLGGAELLSEAQNSLIRRCAAMECELERLEAQLSRYEPVDMLRYAQVAGHLRRIFETLGVERIAKPVQTLDQYFLSLKQADAAAATEEAAP
jgi:hypothetical protein